MREMSLYCSDLHCCCFTGNFATQIRGHRNLDTKFMALIDSIIGVTVQWVASTDPRATLAQPFEWLRKTGGYAAVNRTIIFSISVAPLNGFSVQEVRPGYVRT